MNYNDFAFIAGVLKERSGLALGKEKAYLLESRLNPVARKWHFDGFEELVAAVRLSKNEEIVADIVSAMATTDSSFFRDGRPFGQFRDTLLPCLLERRASSKSLRIWSAGCAGGQEPSSIAIILKEHAEALAGWCVEIVGTDISRDIVEKAKSGVYSQFEVQRGLPVHHLLKYFKQVGERWQLAADIRNMVTYKVFNLLDDASDFGTFDVVFCRNVLAYFDQPTRARVLDSIGRRMPEDGFLYLGVGETALGTAASFRPHAGCRGVFSRLSPSQAQAKLAS